METIHVLPPTTDYGYESFETSDGTVCMHPQMMNESVAAQELLNDLACNCKKNAVMIIACASTMNMMNNTVP